MGCLIACFSASKHPKSLNPPNEVPSSSGTQRHETQEVLLLKQPIEQENIESDISTITKSNDKQEKLLRRSIEKKETYDLKIQSQEEFSTQDITNSFDDEVVEEESSESLFSLSIGSRKHGSESEMDEKEEVNSSITIQIVHSLLKPVDNLSPQKAINERTTTAPLKHQDKENINIETELNIPFSEEPLFHNSKKLIKEENKKPKGEEVMVETSLSSWLVSSETLSSAKNSPNSIGNSFPNLSRKLEDRTILGELNVEELK